MSIPTAVFDLETTGVDARNDLIVTAFVGQLSPEGELLRSREWIVDPNPTGDPTIEANLAAAAEVHGFTRDKLDADPRTLKGPDALATAAVEIATLIARLCLTAGALPLAGANISYDLTMLNAHLVRAGCARLPFGQYGIKVLDSLVLDKHFDKYVKGTGQRKLLPTAKRYGIPFSEEDAHDASFDAVAAGRVCQAIISRHLPHLEAAPDYPTSIQALHESQIRWRAEQQRDLQVWLRAHKDPKAVCETGWPTYA